jgi:lipopolysaccharide heptosyltransferase I
MSTTAAPRRILIVRPSALGDVCRSVPVLASLRGCYPDARIDWVVRDSYVPVIAAHPMLNEAIAFPRARFAGSWRSPRAARELLRWLAELRRRRYDLVVDCQGLGRSGLITFATGAPRRVGFRGARELAWLAYNRRHAPSGDQHTVDQMLELLRGEGIEPVRDMRLYAAEADREWWRRRRAEFDAEHGAYAVLAPTARWSSKRWPIDRWRRLAEALPARGLQRLVVVGAPGEVDQVRELLDAGAVGGATLVDLVGQATLGQTAAAIGEAALVVAHDSAPLHLAVGFDRACVALFGPTDPAIVGPYRRPESVVCKHRPEPGKRVNYRSRRLGDALMRLIAVPDVLERVDAVLERRPIADASASATKAAEMRA